MAMQPAELKQLRQSANMSQAELANQIGMARETIGQMERGQAPIEIRTELAIKFVVAQRPQSTMRSPLVVQKDVADLLVTLSNRPPQWQDVADLRTHQEDWILASGGGPGLVVLQQIVGVITSVVTGLVSATTGQDFIQLREMWATLAPGYYAPPPPPPSAGGYIGRTLPAVPPPPPQN